MLKAQDLVDAAWHWQLAESCGRAGNPSGNAAPARAWGTCPQVAHGTAKSETLFHGRTAVAASIYE